MSQRGLKYKGPPCPACGGTERYDSTKQCVACAKRTAKANRDAKRAEAQRFREEAR